MSSSTCHVWCACSVIPKAVNLNDLIAESSSGTRTFQGSVQLDASALKDNPQWAAYKASLAKNGYFRGNIPGSAQYKELLAEAVQAFGQSEAYQRSANAAAQPGEAIAAILQQPIDRDQFQAIPCAFDCCN